jgi:isocitrate dehydrogenase (NAD+)
MLFTQGTRHAGMDIAGLDKANPTGFILSSIMMLRYLGLP